MLDGARGFCSPRIDVPMPIDREIGFNLGSGMMHVEDFEKIADGLVSRETPGVAA